MSWWSFLILPRPKYKILPFKHKFLLNVSLKHYHCSLLQLIKLSKRLLTSSKLKTQPLKHSKIKLSSDRFHHTLNLGSWCFMMRLNKKIQIKVDENMPVANWDGVRVNQKAARILSELFGFDSPGTNPLCWYDIYSQTIFRHICLKLINCIMAILVMLDIFLCNTVITLSAYRCSPHTADGTLKRLARSKTMNVEEVTTFYECIRSIIKHFLCSVKDKEILDTCLGILELGKMHLVLVWYKDSPFFGCMPCSW